MDRLKSFWTTLKIKNKIAIFTGSAFLVVLFSVMFDVWIIRLFVLDFNNIMEANLKSGNLVAVIDREKTAFEEYIRDMSEDNRQILNKSADASYAALYNIELDYDELGDERFAYLQALRSIYKVYGKCRDELVDGSLKGQEYVDRLYSAYSMQDYLYEYAQKFADYTLKSGNDRYNSILPKIFVVPALSIIMSIVLCLVLLELSHVMNRSITEPVLKLANASRRIAANDFYIDDVEAKSRDELGELITAFNKMKYATGEYIKALEERREALDQLHASELQTLEVEKQLESMNLELLKNQINPHFLFNTLNTIRGMANLENAKSTEKMIEALSSLFRYNLKNQSREVLLSQELKVADDYMYLQKMRFGERVRYEVSCNVNPDGVMVPTFTLQPLLENCVIHGISPKIEGGVVRVTIDREDNKLVLVIADTGMGISRDELGRIRSYLVGDAKADGIGIGIGNIFRRIKAMYSDSEMLIDSTEGAGTRITIEIPFCEGSIGKGDK